MTAAGAAGCSINHTPASSAPLVLCSYHNLCLASTRYTPEFGRNVVQGTQCSVLMHYGEKEGNVLPHL